MQEQERLCFWVVIQFRRPDKFHETFNGFLKADNFIAARRVVKEELIPLLQKRQGFTEPEIQRLDHISQTTPLSGMTDINVLLIGADPVLGPLARQMTPEALPPPPESGIAQTTSA